MRMRSANRHIVVVTCSVVLFSSLCSPREVPMRHQQSVRSEEHGTRMALTASTRCLIATTLTR